MNPVSARLLSQQLVAPEFKDPADVVAWFGAMQAQEYKAMRWAVTMRTRRPSFKAFEKAFNEGRIIRTHLLRTTWQLVAREDFPWMLALCRTKALAGLRGWMHANGIDIPDTEKGRIQELFADYMAGKRCVLKEDLDLALKEKGIEMEDHRLSYHLRLAEFDGLVCSGDLHPTKRTLALVSERSARGRSQPRTKRSRSSPGSISAATPRPRWKTSCGGRASTSATAAGASPPSATNSPSSGIKGRNSTATATPAPGAFAAERYC